MTDRSGSALNAEVAKTTVIRRKKIFFDTGRKCGCLERWSRNLKSKGCRPSIPSEATPPRVPSQIRGILRHAQIGLPGLVWGLRNVDFFHCAAPRLSSGSFA